MIITFIKEDEIVTLDSEYVTETNFAYVERFNSLLVPLAKKAMEILEEGVEEKYSSYYKKREKGDIEKLIFPTNN